jgi:hypothetical protein
MLILLLKVAPAAKPASDDGALNTLTKKLHLISVSRVKVAKTLGEKERAERELEEFETSSS